MKIGYLVRDKSDQEEEDDYNPWHFEKEEPYKPWKEVRKIIYDFIEED